MKLTTVLIDDESSARKILSGYLQKYCDEIEILGFGEDVKTGIEAIQKHQPDLVFLDIEMPFGNGFDLLEHIDTIDFDIIFVTAYSEYAVQALNLSASYYLLKPLSIDELIIAVEKVRKSRKNIGVENQTQVLLDNIKTANKQLQKIILPTLDGFEVVQIKNITHITANDNFSDIYLNKNTKMTICRTLKHFEEILNKFGFIRTHRSHLVNMDYVVKYNKGSGGYLTLNEGTVVNVSPSKKESVLAHFMK